LIKQNQIPFLSSRIAQSTAYTGSPLKKREAGSAKVCSQNHKSLSCIGAFTVLMRSWDDF